MSRLENMNARRVVVTGMAVISPAGCTQEEYWQGLTSGQSALSMVTRFDTSDIFVHIAGQVDLEALKSEIPRSTLSQPDRSIQLGLLAAKRALDDAGVADAARNGLRVGTLLGSGLGPCDTIAINYKAYAEKGVRAVRPATVPRCMFNGIASEASIVFNLSGIHNVTAAACASASLAMGDAYNAIIVGQENVVLTGGCDSPLTHSIYSAWANLRVLSKEPDPARAMRPFDLTRDGFALAEGAAMLVFEELEHARARGAKIYGEILGHGTSSDASHITKPTVEGQVIALREALRLAGLRPEEVDYINAHGTSTTINDATETEAIKRALGEHAREIPISSTKSVLGHTMGASGALELVAVLLAMKHQVAPPTVNLKEPDPECDLDYVANESRSAPIRVALSNSFAFGGSNSVLAIRVFEENEHE